MVNLGPFASFNENFIKYSSGKRLEKITTTPFFNDRLYQQHANSIKFRAFGELVSWTRLLSKGVVFQPQTSEHDFRKDHTLSIYVTDKLCIFLVLKM